MLFLECSALSSPNDNVALYIVTLKTKSSHDANFVFAGSIARWQPAVPPTNDYRVGIITNLVFNAPNQQQQRYLPCNE